MQRPLVLQRWQVALAMMWGCWQSCMPAVCPARAPPIFCGLVTSHVSCHGTEFSLCGQKVDAVYMRVYQECGGKRDLLP